MEKIEHIIRQPENRRYETPVLLLHGAWHSACCWEYWLDYYESLGFEVHAISMPGRSKSSLKKRSINFYSLGNYVEILSSEIDKISPLPVVVGHSLGGAVLQKYLESHSLPGAVLLASMPSSGGIGMAFRLIRSLPFVSLKGMLTLNSSHWVGTPELAQALLLSPDTTCDVTALQKTLVKESMLVNTQTMFPYAKMNKIKSPVLVLYGDKDAAFTETEQQATADKYKAEYVVFKGQAHNLMMEPDWQHVADTIIEWMLNTLKLQ